MAKRGRRAPQRPSSPPPQPPSPPPPPRSAIRRRLVFATTFVVGLISLIASIDGLWGPIWPTTPDIHPGTPDPVSPFAVPFTIKNRSVLFNVENGSIVCFVDRLKAKDNWLDLTKNRFRVADGLTLVTEETRPFSCKISVPFFSTEEVVMRFSVEYQVNFICSGCVLRHIIGPFSWNGRAWSEGKPFN
jgi:hypothetical protein